MWDLCTTFPKRKVQQQGACPIEENGNLKYQHCTSKQKQLILHKLLESKFPTKRNPETHYNVYLIRSFLFVQTFHWEKGCFLVCFIIIIIIIVNRT